jgi:hypothetical protein
MCWVGWLVGWLAEERSVGGECHSILPSLCTSDLYIILSAVEKASPLSISRAWNFLTQLVLTMLLQINSVRTL